MFKLFSKKYEQAVPSCANCKYFVKGTKTKKPSCTKVPRNSFLKSFPFNNTKCKTYESK